VLSILDEKCELDDGEEGLVPSVVCSSVESQLPDARARRTSIRPLSRTIISNDALDQLSCCTVWGSRPFDNSTIYVGSRREGGGRVEARAREFD